MKSSRLPILVIIALLGLLVLLAGLQYHWLGQISDAEKVRLERRLQDDTKRFAEDFNREIQDVYFFFKFTADNFNSFEKRFKVWEKKTAYPDLVEGFYFVKTSENDELTRFDKQKLEFVKTNWTDELRKIRKSFADENKFEEFSQANFALISPVHKTLKDNQKLIKSQKNSLIVQSANGKILTENIVGPDITEVDVKKLVKEMKIPDKNGFLIIKLNEKIIKESFLPNLAGKYFSENDGGSYKLSIIGKNDLEIYKNHRSTLEKSDAEVKLFSLSANNFVFFGKDEVLPKNEQTKDRKIVFRNSISATTIRKTTGSGISTPKNEVVDIDIIDNKKPHMRFFESAGDVAGGLWTLKVQHNSGSLEQFITNTRRTNLAISFGILSLLAVSIIFIFISSQRAKSLAQKQMDFVSSVSHEFRTPLAVIYSAGENLTDGVVIEKEKVSKYGKLVKKEGRKLSGMVEQILEFAGANSGKRKYDLSPVNVSEVVKEAIRECESVILEKDFNIEQEISETLPQVYGDEKALTQAVQNLINNSLKYCNGTKWMKVTAKNGGGKVKIIVEDRGIGISAKDKRHIFEPFFRSKTVVDEQISGNGLGLSLVKQIIEAHQGQIEVESEIKKGSKFTIQLPIKG